MTNAELIRKLACQASLPDAAAADELNRLIARILRSLRKGQSVPLPGIGILHTGAGQTIELKPLDSLPKKAGRRKA